VNDPESGPEPFKENSPTLNPNLKGRDIRKAFEGDEYQILLVANKFQTGFDQPLLCGMYVDKRLAGIQAVQTLSRLNRCYPGKDTTYVLDFVNEPQDVLEAFKTYYTTAQLSDTTDPNLILQLRAKLDGTGYYDDFEINRVVEVELSDNATQGKLAKALEPVADRILKRFSAAKEAFKGAEDGQAKQAAKDIMDALQLFKSDMSTYIRARFEFRVNQRHHRQPRCPHRPQHPGAQLRADTQGAAIHPARSRWFVRRAAKTLGVTACASNRDAFARNVGLSWAEAVKGDAATKPKSTRIKSRNRIEASIQGNQRHHRVAKVVFG